MFKNFDWLMLTLVLLLMSIGLFVIYSATLTTETEAFGYFIKQIIWGIIGIFILFIVSFMPLRFIQKAAYPLYLFVLFLLLLVLFIGKVGQGAERWLAIGPLHIQPSEIAKLASVLALSNFLAEKRLDINKFKFFAIAAGIVFLPFALIVKQPDLGTSLVFIAIFIPMMYWAGLNWFYIFTIITPVFTMIFSFHFWAFLLLMLVIGLVLFFSGKKVIVIVSIFVLNIFVGIMTPTLWNQLRPYQQQRISTFVNPEKDPKGAGYQIIQSQVAIGSGGIWGTGRLGGTQTQLRFLPAQHTDFIFSVVGEEFGFLGVSSILLIYLLLLLRLVNLAASTHDLFTSLTVIGITTVIGFHILINIGMTIGLAPVTGLPLPFLSYGGSFLLSNLLMIAVILNISRNRYNY